MLPLHCSPTDGLLGSVPCQGLCDILPVEGSLADFAGHCSSIVCSRAGNGCILQWSRLEQTAKTKRKRKE